MVTYHFEDTDFQFKNRKFNNMWLKMVVESEIKKLGQVAIVFCSDNYILDINQRYLQHDYFTDIITFDYCENNLISGDLFISVDSVKENSLFYGVDFENELNRVIVHGIGYDDHSEEDIKVMREKENYYLELRSKLL